MPYSDEELQTLYGGLGVQTNDNTVAEPAWKTAKQVANIVPKAANNLIDSANSVASWIAPDTVTPEYLKEAKDPIPTFDVGPNTGIKDAILNNMAPEVASWMVPYLGASKGLKVAMGAGRVASILTEGLAQGGANLLSSAKMGDEGNPLSSGIMGTASGMLQMALPRWQRALPLAAVSGLDYLHTGNAWEAGGNFVGNMLPGAFKKAADLDAIAKVIHPDANIQPAPVVGPTQLGPQMASDAMQSRLAAPLPGNPLESPSLEGHFSFIDEVKSNFPQGTSEGTEAGQLGDLQKQLEVAQYKGDISGVRTLQSQISDLTKPQDIQQGSLGDLLGHQLQTEHQPEFHFEDSQPKTGLRLDELPPEGPTHIEPSQPNTEHLRLEGQPRPEPQGEFPLIKLQSEGTLNPNAPKFQLIEAPVAPKAEPKNLELFDWRNEAIKQKGPLLLEDAKSGAKPPEGSSPSVAPEPPAPRKYTPAIKDENGVIHTGETHEAAGQGKTVTERGFVDGEGKFKTLTEVARAEAPKNPNKAEVEHVTPDGQTHTISVKKSGRTGFLADVKEAGSTDWTEAVPGGRRTKTQTIDAARAWLDQKYSHTPEPQAELPEVMTTEGAMMDVKPRMAGPHIISTIVKDNDTGGLLAGRDWNTSHDVIKKNDPEGLMMTKFHDPGAPGEVEHMFLAQDEKGVIRPVDRVEGMRIAKKAGQTTKTEGPLHSQDLINPPPETPKPDPKKLTPTATEKAKPEEVKASEAQKAVDETAAIEQQLRDNVKAASDKNDNLGLRIATRKLNDFLAVTKPEEFAAKQAAVEAAHGKSVDVDPKMQTTAKDSTRRFMARYNNQSGQIQPETLAVMAAASVGGLIAYQQTKGDIGSTLAAATVLAGLGFLGAKGIKDLRGLVGAETKAVTKASLPPVAESLTKKLVNFAIDTAKTPGGYAVFGRGGIQATALRMIEGLAGALPQFKDAKILADGFIAHQLNELASALDTARPYKPTPGFAEASSRFLRGQLVDKPTVEAAIKSGGGVDNAAWAKLDAKARLAYPEKWMVTDHPDITNTSGPGTTVYHVTNSTKSKLMQMQRDSLNALASAPEDKEFMPFVLKSRDITDSLMQVVHNAVPPGEQLNKIMGTMGQYMTRSHALLTDPKYFPTDVEIGRAMDRLAAIKEDRFLEKYASATSSPGTVPITYKGTTHYVSPDAAKEWSNLHTPESLKSLVHQYIHEIKQIAAGKVQGLISKDTEQLGTSLFARRKELDEVTQALLGTHIAPAELIQHTINKLLPTARAAHFMQDLIGMADESTGLKMGYKSEVEYNKAVNDIKEAMRLNPGPEQQRVLSRQLEELSNYVPVSGQNPRMGIFQGSYVSRLAHDQLAGFSNPMGILDNSIGRGLATFNQLIKETHLIANPIVHVRNFWQIPMFLAMGGAADSPAAWKSAYEAIKDPNSIIGKRLTLNGVFVGNMIHGELNHSLQELLNGDADKNIFQTMFGKDTSEKTILGALKKGELRAASHMLYAQPDNFVRASVYLAAEQRAAKKFGVSVDAMDPRVMKEAREFMTRRTMDYGNVAQWAKIGRQIPFVSMFLSYTHEIMRITANTAKDALKGDLRAGAALGGLATLPFLAQNMAENALSPEDRKAWIQTQRVVQDYSRPRFKLPLSRNKDGTFNYVDITPLMPLNDFQMAARSVARGDTESLVATNPIIGLDKTPLLGIAAEQITGKEMHSGKEFRNAWDRASAIAQEILPPHTPGIGNEWVKGMPEAVGGRLGVTNLRNARTNTIEGALSRHLTGVDMTQVNPDIAVRNYVASAKRDIANERQYFMDTMKATGISADAQKRAQDKFVEAVNHITQDLQLRLQLQPTNPQ